MKQSYTFFCKESDEHISVYADSVIRAFELANKHFRKLWAKNGTQFYSWMGNGNHFTASYGAWD